MCIYVCMYICNTHISSFFKIFFNWNNAIPNLFSLGFHLACCFSELSMLLDVLVVLLL